ncbi:ABC transporter ATP-binding protein [Macrococcus capreoli]|uniref:ABC transporter ATP-binding protein n=1 Tax=Macrococcus capreoli TaxID=2982690 RepID=UPI003EE6B5D9
MAALLTVERLSVTRKKRKKMLNIIDNISFDVNEGEIFALVGESGSGKSITVQAVTGMLSPGLNMTAENIQMSSWNLKQSKRKDWEKIRGNHIGMVFQDPMTSLNPTLTIGKQLTEIFTIKEKATLTAAKERAIQLLKDVDITLPETRLKQYPHELSGGMRQRVLIAMAMAQNPELIIADEPTTALDVTTQKQILHLLHNHKTKRNGSVLIITHDLGVVAEIADRVGIMYAGKLVEIGTVHDIFNHPQHPYTKGLLASLIKKDTNKDERLYNIEGTPPTPEEKEGGCPFVNRCDFAMKICNTQFPPEYRIQSQKVACWLHAPEREKGDVHG